MSLFDRTDLTFNGKEIKELSQAVFEAAFDKPSLQLFHKVATGIVVKEQIAIFGRLKGLVGAGSGECNPTSAPNTFDATEKFWDPEYISDRLSQCWKDLEKSFWEWGLAKGVKKSDLTNGDFFNFVKEILMDAVVEAVYRIVWFNDTEIEHQVDGGILIDPPAEGSNLAYWNRIDGLWKQIFAEVALNPLRKTAGLATKNAGATYLLQEFTLADRDNLVVTTMLQNLRFGSDMRLRKMQTLKVVVTQSVADQYEKELLFAKVTYDTVRIEDGITMLKTAGIEVIAFEFWDRMIRTYFDNGTTYFLPHRALLLVPDNFQVGVEDESTLTELDTHYDKTTKLNHIDFGFKIDAKLIQDYLFQAAY